MIPKLEWSRRGRWLAAVTLVCAVGCAADGENAVDPGETSTATTGTAGSGSGAGGSTAAAGPTTSGGGEGASVGGASGVGGSGGAIGSGGSGGAGGTGGTGGGGPTGPTPWDASPCTSPTVTEADLLDHFAAAATTATFGDVWADARARNCQDQTGCQPWQPASAADLYRIQWNGSGFDFVDPTNLQVPSGGTITCTVPGPNCMLTIGPMTSNVYPPEQGRPLGITPRVSGAQVQVGNWSFDPGGNYIQYESSIVTQDCLWGSMKGRVYGASGTYVETQLVVWGSF